jgi:hypothetical protein
LKDEGVPLTLADLADEVAVWEADTVLPKIPCEEVKSVYLSLYHAHIPKMADVGVVEYSQDEDMVRLAEEYKELASVIQLPVMK